MIYTNFLLFIVAVVIFATAPLAPGSGGAAPPVFNLYGIGLLLLVFWQFNRYKFMKLRSTLEHEGITVGAAKKKYLSITNIHLIFSLFVFAAEIFLFDLKYFLTRVPLLGESEILMNATGIAVFILHLTMVWYWAYRAMGDTIFIGRSAYDHIMSNIKFNLVIVIPWLALSLFYDVITIFSSPTLFRLISSPFILVIVFGCFFVVLAIFAPVFMTWLWDCKPLEESELKGTIDNFCRSQGVKFKNIMSWNALNGGLVTAGVLGLVSSFRYLLITPELMKLLDKDELLGVVSHEVGHVKKNHLRYYLVFLLAFMLISLSVVQLIYSLILKTSFGLSITIKGGAIAINTPLEYINNIFFIFLLILYFRFIFGYFMRNFEREADIFCFHTGISPQHLISSFNKLEENMGGEGKKSNWHHYTISQRVGFLRTCMENPEQITAHENKVKRSLKVFLSVMLVVVLLSSYMFIANPDVGLDAMPQLIEALEKEIERNSDNPELYTALGQLYYNDEKWEEAKGAYEASIQLKYGQPTVLNNLAWMLLKCPDEKFINPKRALKLARDAAEMDKKSFHILDTLAEAYFQNAMYKEAYHAAQRAYIMATENLKYYEDQLRKMTEYYQRFKSAITI